MLELISIAHYAHVLMKEKSWDIFCKVVDNFGDIGVCWRLAKQLQHEHNIRVRLFVDRLDVARHILVGLENLAEQDYGGVQIIRWQEDTEYRLPASVVIETFACGLPDAYLALMDRHTLWVNVDYLSAESWVSGFHGLNGQHQETTYTRHFYFPGFLESTGGLFREQALLTKRNVFQQSDNDQAAFWQQLGIQDNKQLKISLFSYENAPVEQLLQTIAENGPATTVLMPHQAHIPTSLFGNQDFVAGDVLTIGHLALHVLPFLSQDTYDQLLWACDINFVRGEDSWLRAIWAGRPFVWQPYWQIDDAHLVKLNAFVDLFYEDAAFKKDIFQLHRSWSTGRFPSNTWRTYLDTLEVVHDAVQKRTTQLAEQATLASKLVAFCEKREN